jgi:hypothetical protein
LQESSSDIKGIVLGMERVQAECFKIRSENRDLKTGLNILKEQSRNTNKLMQSQNDKLSTIMDMITKLTGNRLDISPQSVTSSKKRF